MAAPENPPAIPQPDYDTIGEKRPPNLCDTNTLLFTSCGDTSKSCANAISSTICLKGNNRKVA